MSRVAREVEARRQRELEEERLRERPRTEGDKPYSSRRVGRPRRFTDEQVAALCEARDGRATVSDREAGAKVGASRSLFGRWRKRAGIEPFSASLNEAALARRRRRERERSLLSRLRRGEVTRADLAATGCDPVAGDALARLWGFDDATQLRKAAERIEDG